MSSFSISFTLGKASVQHGANVEHNNREFIAANIDLKRTHENITYVKQDVREAYHELFDNAINEYNQKQKRNDRKISDYYQHIADGKREEAYYEIVVQFGDSKTAPCGSENAKITQQLLDEYMRSFRKRNPNLYVFNAVMHMDEASPHLHINFIPFYTKGRTNGLSKGVSMRAALDEQGFTAQNFKDNRLVTWEESERAYMEHLLHESGFTREDKNAKYAHMTVEEFKKTQDEKKMVSAIRTAKNITAEELDAEHVTHLKRKLQTLEREKKTLESEKLSPYKSFYYSAPDKQAFVQSRLDELGIPYRETENGFEAQECFIEQIRKIEKEYKAPRTTAKEILRDEIDKLLMQSDSVEELLKKLEQSGYTVKTGKYISVKPKKSGQFIRLKSLGEHYSEFALRNRINSRKKYESNLEQTINDELKKKQTDSPKIMVLRTIKFYTVAFRNGGLPMRKRNQKKPFSWTNDSELDRIMILNQKINSGATLESLRNEFEKCEQIVSAKEQAFEKSRKDLKAFYELKEKIEIVFEGKHSDIFTMQQARETLQHYPTITANNYRNIENLIRTETENLKKLETDLNSEREKLKQADEIFVMAEKVMGGTYVQSLVAEERERKESKFVPNGLKPA